ncbi:MAG TPA: hypothetical protein VL120_00730, partial [Solirubrobacteraceae bacterium]|nr:hypothetical protein [Solirubrobacteraceae bacterium]
MASTVTAVGTAYTFDAAAGAVPNNLTISQASANEITFDDSLDAIAGALPAGCVQVVTTVTCTAGGPVTVVTANLGDGDNLATSTDVGVPAGSASTVVMNGGTGTDNLT